MSVSSPPQPHGHTPSAASVPQSLQEYGRGVVGGLLFSLPLLYTMEVWWGAVVFTPARLLAGLVGTYALLLLYNQYAGIRANAHRGEVWIDSVEELGIGLVMAVALLALLGRLGSGADVGLVVTTAMALAVGVSVGTAQLGSGSPDEQGQTGDERQPPTLGADLSLSLCGAVLLALNIAPTEEVLLLAAEGSPARLGGIAALSLALCSVVLFFSSFHGSRGRRAQGLAHLVRGTVDTYAVALVASAALLAFFGRFDGATPYAMAAMTVVLGLPAALGASAGRLLLRPDDGDDDDGDGDDAEAPGTPSSPSAP